MAGNNKMSPRKAMAMGKAAKKAGVRKMNRGGPMKPVMRRGGSGKKKT